MKVSIVIPVYNEKNTIIELVNKVVLLEFDKEIIIVDDGSTDGTSEILDNLIPDKVDKVIHKKNGGKGSALQAGFSVASGDIIIPQDADLELNPDEIINVINPIITGKTKSAAGSRFLNKKHKKGGKMHVLANLILSKFASLMFKQKITDINTCYIAFERELLPKLKLKENKFGINEEIFGKLSNLNIKIIETQISYEPRTASLGKKLKYKDGFDAVRVIWKCRKRRINNIK